MSVLSPQSSALNLQSAVCPSLQTVLMENTFYPRPFIITCDLYCENYQIETSSSSIEYCIIL